MTSPIDILKPYIRTALIEATASRYDKSVKVIEANQVRIVFNEAQYRPFFRIDSEGEISVGVKCLERLWAISYVYFLFYEGRAISLRDTNFRKCSPELGAAFELLRWATAVDWQAAAEGDSLSTTPIDWPSGLPRPARSPRSHTTYDIADKLFIYALQFILRHELAHLYLGHLEYGATNNDESIQLEKDADRLAVEWLLDGLDENEEEFTRRIWGIAIVLIWLARRPTFNSSPLLEHPPGHDRLFQTLSNHVSNESHSVWGLALMAFHLHALLMELDFDVSQTTGSPEDRVNQWCDFFAQQLYRPET